MYGLGTRYKNNILLHLPNAMFPPDEHATGNAFSPSEAALLLVSTKRSAASGDENAGRECRKSLLTSHSVMEMCCSCFINTKYKCLKSELPTCNKCSVFEENEDVEG